MAARKQEESSSTNKKRKTQENTNLNSMETDMSDIKNKEDTSISFKRRREFGVNLYPASHKGPAYVAAIFGKSVAKPRNLQNALILARALSKNHEGVEEIKNEGFGKFNIKFKSHIQANKFVKAEKKDLQGINTFIPKYRICRKGLIKGFSTDCDLEDIQKYSDSPVPILNARRLNRKVSNPQTGSGEWIPSETIVITFEGTILPDYIKLYNLIHTPVELYIEPLKICYNCFRTGHTAKFCRSEMICKCCGTPGHNISDCQSDTPTCAHCKEAHQTLHPSCSALQTNKEINRQMSLLNVSFYEAKQIITKLNSGKKSNTTLDTKENFPPLRPISQQNIIHLKTIGGQQAPASSSPTSKSTALTSAKNNVSYLASTTTQVYKNTVDNNPTVNNLKIRQNSTPTIVRATNLTKTPASTQNLVTLIQSSPLKKLSPAIKHYKPSSSISSKP
ncbi:uncharacterized protein LOC143211120 [Lasioglossum baleicum]|uniref:uncharacterized protein LOC143211120 n=1 Tax=Lasioglossum baleicum TaxID=434251 RepID=UPI003FCD1A5B